MPVCAGCVCVCDCWSERKYELQDNWFTCEGTNVRDGWMFNWKERVVPLPRNVFVPGPWSVS